ncbi:MAG: CPBP family intramembrane glutamic endopeptidase [Nitrososphaeraceae archaeon]|nr:CPBP family intramembrane glutamic endopeptidase [Nitrososphaeraceae archaeon]
MKQFFLGILFIWFVYSLIILLQHLILDTNWNLRNDISFNIIPEVIWYHLKSALTEDLLFRGILLYLLVKKIGLQKASLLSGFVFGVYHWFSYGIIGSGIVPMIFVLLSTGFMGYVWAIAYGKTNSILLGLGLHFGWNIFTTLFFTSTPYGEILFIIQESPSQMEPWITLFYLIKGFLPPLLTLIFIKIYFEPLKIDVEVN